MENNKFENLIDCPYCLKSDFIKLFSAPDRFGDGREKFFLSKCLNCKLVFQNPRIRENYIASYYTDNLGYYSPAEIGKGFIVSLKNKLERAVLSNHFNYTHLISPNFFIKLAVSIFVLKYRVKLTPVFVPNGVLFEIGCSHGASLKRMKDLGWRVSGSEMNKKSVDYAKSMGLDVNLGRIEDLTLPKGSLDAVCMSMVLEHVYNPFGVLSKVSESLKSKGQLIFSIPYFGGLEYRLFKEYSYGLHLPHHITFLNKKIIKEYLTRLGFTDIKFYFHSFDRDIVASAGYKYQDTGRYVYKIIWKSRFLRVFLFKPLVYILSLLHLTSRVTVYAIKK